jgi:hypothetical protein
MDLQAPIFVVSSHSTGDGTGGERQVNYSYAGAKVDLQGRGFLGFREFAVSDQQTGIRSSISYHQDYPYVGLASRVDKTTAAGALLSRLADTCAAVAYGGTRYFPYVSQRLESGSELNGAPLPTTTTSTSYDAFGNTVRTAVSTGDGYSKTTTNAYANDTTNWLLGRLIRSQLTSTTP